MKEAFRALAQVSYPLTDEHKLKTVSDKDTENLFTGFNTNILKFCKDTVSPPLTTRFFFIIHMKIVS